MVALKVIRSGDMASREEVRRFLAEAESAAQLDHPGIVPVYEAGQHGDSFLSAMALVEGESLWQAISRRPFDSREAARLLLAAAEGVQHAHERGKLVFESAQIVTRSVSEGGRFKTR